ncbi:MAG: TetR/AcrR family transcriptional regulator [Coriobacteriales bacterium]|jgi:AcrR family transcriptional regulator|nr:TetR/AcrR family transcriptional regulator [Coriobacteriales bacterium]
MINETVSQEAVLSRSFRTKIRIAQALNSLCEQTPYLKISAEAIAKKADISRSGFYHHFADKDAIVQWLTSMFYSYGVDQIGRSLTWFESYLATTRSFMHFRSLFVSEPENVSYSSGRSFYIRHRLQTLRETLTQYKHLDISDLLAFQIEALVHTEVAMTSKYFDQMDCTLKQFCDMMETAVPRELHDILAEPEEHVLLKGDFWISSGMS